MEMHMAADSFLDVLRRKSLTLSLRLLTPLLVGFFLVVLSVGAALALAADTFVVSLTNPASRISRTVEP
jgi:hypothetical protein